MPTESIRLLSEGLLEIVDLADEAKRRNHLLYEGIEYTPFEIVLLEAEDAEDKFLDRTTAAVEKITAAGEAGIKELTELQTALQGAGLENSVAAVSKAIVKLQKSIPEGGFLGKLKSLGAAGLGALFGKGDDPAEKIAEIVGDGVRYQEMMNNIVSSLLKDLSEIQPEGIVGEIETENGGEFSDERKAELINQIKEQILGGTLNNLISSDEEPFVSVREAIDFSEKTLKAVIKKSIKPSKWFSGLKSLGGALGFGLGGDLPFQQFGLKYDDLYDDIVLVNISSLQQLAKSTATDSDDKAVRDDLASGTEELAGLDSERGAVAQDAQADAGTGSAPESTEPADADTTTQSGGEAAEDDQSSYLKILQSVPGVREPEQGVDKLVDLLAAGFSYLPSLGLRNLLSEKVLRYDDVVTQLADHLPEDEDQIPDAIRKLADEMKVELGGDYDIVGGPDQIAALRDEVQALRNLLQNLPEEERATTADSFRDAFEEDGLPPDVVNDLLDLDVPLGDAIDEVPDESLGDISDNIPDDVDANVEIKPQVGDFYEYEVRTGKNKGKKFGVKVSEVNDDTETVVLQRPNKSATKFTANVFAVKIDYLGNKLDTEEEALAVFSAAETEKNESASFSNKERLARVAVCKMRGYILQETNNFKYTSDLAPHEVVTEFYKLGGTNELIAEKQKHIITDRWSVLAGLNDE